MWQKARIVTVPEKHHWSLKNERAFKDSLVWVCGKPHYTVDKNLRYLTNLVDKNNKEISIRVNCVELLPEFAEVVESKSFEQLVKEMGANA